MFDRKTYARSLSNATRNQRHNGIFNPNCMSAINMMWEERWERG